MSREIKTKSNLEKILAAGHFAVTGELGPPRSADIETVTKKAKFLLNNVDSVNITDNQTAVVRMSSLAASLHLQSVGIEANMQLVSRDRNRIAIQSDVLGAYSLGINNILCLSGDHQVFGDHPQAKNVFDIDVIQIINTIKMMRDERKLLSGQEMAEGTEPRIFIGAAFNPFADPEDYRVIRAAKKVEAGADYLQSQCIYNMEKFTNFMKKAVDMGLTEKAYFMAGITPLKSLGMTKYMKNSVPGIEVPDEYIERMGSVPKDKQAEEGIKIACEQIEIMQAMEGVAGIHLMAIEWEHMVPEIVEKAKLIPRPKV